MTVVDILENIKDAKGTNAKKEILSLHKENELLKKALLYGLDPFTPFHLVKVPKTKSRHVGIDEQTRWTAFFTVADLCATRGYTGNFAIQMMSDAFCVATEEEEKWMRKILKKHLAMGASQKTINAIFPELIPVFELALAQKFQKKRIANFEEVAVEPKLDGIRYFAIVENGSVQFFTRSGKIFPNIDPTICNDLLKLGDGCYDGELMGDDFVSLMRQAYRKDPDLSDVYFAVFDYLPLEEWKSQTPKMSCHYRHEKLLDKLTDNDIDFKKIVPVERVICDATYEEIRALHDEWVTDGYEGAMIKDLSAPYCFGRNYSVMKLKAFHDVDLEIKGFTEGAGRHRGKLGAVVVDYNGVDVQVGSGFSDGLREQVWNDKENFTGRMIEIRYQEVTPDGSLRFPTFVCFRNDRE